MILLDRGQAGRQLAERVAGRALRNPAVLVIPPGGVRIGWEISRKLGAPMDVISSLEVTSPCEQCTPLGAVADGVFIGKSGRSSGPGLVPDESYESRLVEFDTHRQQAQDTAYRRGLPALDIANRDVILVDDGWATTEMIEAALEAIRRRRAGSMVYVTPQCQADTFIRLGTDVIVESLAPREACRSIMLVDESFEQTTQSEVAELIRKSRVSAKTQPALASRPTTGAPGESGASRLQPAHAEAGR